MATSERTLSGWSRFRVRHNYHRHRMRSLLAEADQILETAESDVELAASLLPAQSHESLPETAEASTSAGSSQALKADPEALSLDDRLLELHVSESRRELPWSSHLNPCSNLLATLCRRQPVNRLVAVLPAGENFYTVLLHTKDGQEHEIFRFPYEDDHFLTCVNNQELPTILLDLLESLCSDLFYSGCIITEVRDARRRAAAADGSATGADLSFVLLRPTTQSIICDSHLLAPDATPEQRAAIEGQLLLATQEPLCLDPNPAVAIAARKAAIARQKLNTVPLRRLAQRHYSQAAANRKRKLEAQPSPAEVRLLDFVQSSTATAEGKRLKRSSAQDALHRHQTLVRAALRAGGGDGRDGRAAGATQPSDGTATPTSSTSSSPPPTTPTTPTGVTDVERLARPMQRRPDINDMTPHVVEEYLLETAERGSQHINHTRLTILQRLANDEYLGELYVEGDSKDAENMGSTGRFVLGTRTHALRYINQFTEIFTEEGRKPVKITHRVPNQQPRVTYTQGMRERMMSAQQQLQQQQQQQQQPGQPGQPAPPPPNVAGKGAVTISLPATPAPNAAALANGPIQIVPASTVQPQPQQPTVLQKKIVLPTAPLLQQQLNLGVSAQLPQQQLPLHPLPPGTAGVVSSSLGSSTATANSSPHHSSILQTQLTLQMPVSHPGTPSAGHMPLPSPARVSTPATPMTPQQLQSPAAPNTALPQPGPTVLAQPQVITAKDQQEKEISAIMQSLMNDSAQFEAETRRDFLQVSPSLAQTPPQQQQPAHVLGLAQLPTRPVPPSSLAIIRPQQQANPKLSATRVSLQNILQQQLQSSNPPPQSSSPASVTSPMSAASPSPGSTPTKASSTMPQLAAQLSRPVQLPPPYTQAVAQAQQQQLRPRLVIASPQSKSLSQDSPGLQALLANAPSADHPIAVGTHSADGMTVGGSTLLERLVSGGPVGGTTSMLSPPPPPHAPSASSSPAPSSSLSQAARSLPVLPASAATDQPQEITLQALLAKPPVGAVQSPPQNRSITPTSSASPSKPSALLQQLQQPFSGAHRQLIQTVQSSPGRGLTSQVQLQQSPRAIQPSPSPRTLPPSPLPRQQGTQPITLQQHAGMRGPQMTQTLVPVQDLMGVGGGQPQTVTVITSNGLSANGNRLLAPQQQTQQQLQQAQASQTNVVNLQSLLQTGVVQVSAAPSGGQLLQTQGPANMVQLQIPGQAAPVTLSFSLPQDGLVPTSSSGPLFVAAQAPGNASQAQHKLQVTNVGKHAPQQQQIVLQTAGGGLIQLPQQPVKAGDANMLKAVPGGQLLQMRPAGASGAGSGPVILQMPVTSQNIQIVRQAQQQPQSVLMPSDGSLVFAAADAQQQQQQQQQPQQQQFLLLSSGASTQKQQNAPAANAFAAQGKVRQQRKQSLK